MTNTQFLPEPGATLLVEVMDLVTHEVAVWVVPSRRRRTRASCAIHRSPAHLRIQVRDDIGVMRRAMQVAAART